MAVISTTPPPSPNPELDALFLEVIGTREGRSDPYSRYKVLRETAPVYRTGLGVTVCTRYEDCQSVLRDPRFGKGGDGLPETLADRFDNMGIEGEDKALLMDRHSLLFLNPPDHTRLRRLVSKAFTPRTVERLRPAITEMIDSHLDEVVTGEATEVMGAFAFPLPANVISVMLGVDEADWPRFRHVMHEATVMLEPVMSEAELESAAAAQLELMSYFRQLVAKRRSEPRGDLVSELVSVQEGSDRLTDSELVSTLILLFGAGFETTTNLIGNGLYSLLTSPEALSGLRRELASGNGDEALRLAVEELLRWESPVQFDGRTALEAVEVAGFRLDKGDEVLTLLGAANHDPQRFSDPEKLDLRRDEGPPISFGSGIHYCLGQALARAEGQIVFKRLLERFDEMSLATSEVVWQNRITLRGLVELPVVFA